MVARLATGRPRLARGWPNSRDKRTRRPGVARLPFLKTLTFGRLLIFLLRAIILESCFPMIGLPSEMLIAEQLFSSRGSHNQINYQIWSKCVDQMNISILKELALYGGQIVTLLTPKEDPWQHEEIYSRRTRFSGTG